MTTAPNTSAADGPQETWLPCLRSTLPDTAAWQCLLQTLGRQISAMAGVVWLPQLVPAASGSGQNLTLKLAAPWGEHAGLSDYAGPQREDMQRAAAECLRGAKPLLLMPHLQLPERQLFNRSNEALVTLPVVHQGAVVGVLQWWAAASLERDALAQGVEALYLDCATLGLRWREREAGLATKKAAAQAEVLQMAADLVAAPDAARMAQMVAAHALAMLGGERATVLVRQRGRWRVLAVSGQDRVDARGQHARAAVHLAKARSTVAGGQADPPPPAPLAGLRVLSSADSVATASGAAVPPEVVLPAQLTVEWAEPGQEHQPWGMLWLEGVSPSTFEFWEHVLKTNDSGAVAPLQTLRGLAAAALRAALVREVGLLARWFGRPASASSHFDQARPAGRWVWRLAPALLVLAAAFWPWPVKLEADCMVLPAQSGYVAAEVSGRVQEILVREGDLVQSGQLVARLDSSRLETELQTAEQMRLRLEGEAERHRGKGDEALSRVFVAQARAAETECLRLKEAIALCELKTPVGGVVVTRDLHLLTGVFLEAGQNLAEVAGTAAWNLRLELREQDLEPLMNTLKEGGKPEVRYILNTHSSDVLSARIVSGEEIGPAVVHAGGKGAVPVLVGPLEVPEGSGFRFRSGLSGKAAVVLPKRPLISVMTRGFGVWLRMHWWL